MSSSGTFFCAWAGRVTRNGGEGGGGEGVGRRAGCGRGAAQMRAADKDLEPVAVAGDQRVRCRGGERPAKLPEEHRHDDRPGTRVHLGLVDGRTWLRHPEAVGYPGPLDRVGKLALQRGVVEPGPGEQPGKTKV